jgi:hypothetical protein
MRARASWDRYMLRIAAGAVVLIPTAGLVWLRAGAPEDHALRGALLSITEGIALVRLAPGLNQKQSSGRRFQQ